MYCGGDDDIPDVQSDDKFVYESLSPLFLRHTVSIEMVYFINRGKQTVGQLDI